MTDELRDQVARERQTETEIRKLDTSQVVEWIHGLEDGYADLELQVDRLRDTHAAVPHEELEQLRADARRYRWLQREWREMRAELGEVVKAIGTSRYMDPPDGGSPTIAEQVARLRAELAERDGQEPVAWVQPDSLENVMEHLATRESPDPRLTLYRTNETGCMVPLYRRPPSPRPAVPEGTPFMPDEPTSEIYDSVKPILAQLGGYSPLFAIRVLYHAIRDAAPTPPADGEAQCPMGDGCDLTVAYMAGFARGKDASGDGREAWRPIESAPRDGSKFLAYEEGHWYAARYFDPEVLEAYCGQPVVQPPEPTHWQPLPAPPAAQAEKGGV